MSGMSFDDAIAAEPAKSGRGPRCPVAALRDRLEDGDRVKLDALLDEVRRGDRTQMSVARILDRTGNRIKVDRLGYHMRGECKCPKTTTG